MKAFVPVLVLLAACAHTDVVGIDTPGTNRPFSATPPVRLTFNSAGDLRPHFSQDGQRLLYTYERGTPDRDRCLGVLPATGGQRVAEVCANEEGQGSRSDGFELGALSSSGLLAYTRHSGTSGGPTSTSAALYVAPLDSLAGARKVFDLLSVPAGGNGKYDYLLDPVWTGPNELVALAARAEIAKACDGCPWDTTFVGIEIVRFDVSGATAQRNVIAPAANASEMAFDASLSRLYFLVPKEGAPDEIHAVPLSGGTPMVAFVEPEVDGGENGYLASVAAGGGKLAISRWYRRPAFAPGNPVPYQYDEYSEIAVVGSGDVLTVVAQRHSEFFVMTNQYIVNEGQWGRIALSPDGRLLAAESIGGLGNDLYLFTLP